MIRHAGLLLPLTVGSLTVAMIGSTLGRLLVSAVGCTALLPALQMTAGLAAVALAPVTGAADEKQRAAAFGPATTLTQNDNRIGHESSPGGDWTTAQDRGRLQSVCGGSPLCTELPQPDLDRVTGRGPPSSWTANNTLSKGKIHLVRNREMKARTHLAVRMMLKPYPNGECPKKRTSW